MPGYTRRRHGARSTTARYMPTCAGPSVEMTLLDSFRLMPWWHSAASYGLTIGTHRAPDAEKLYLPDFGGRVPSGVVFRM